MQRTWRVPSVSGLGEHVCVQPLNQLESYDPHYERRRKASPVGLVGPLFHIRVKRTSEDAVFGYDHITPYTIPVRYACFDAWYGKADGYTLASLYAIKQGVQPIIPHQTHSSAALVVRTLGACNNCAAIDPILSCLYGLDYIPPGAKKNGRRQNKLTDSFCGEFIF